MMVADRVIRWSTAGGMIGVAAVAAVASYERAYDLVRAHGAPGLDGSPYPVDRGRTHLREFDGDARLSTSARPRACAGAVAARSGHRGDARRERGRHDL
jgi:hypothetical protein